MPDRHETPQQGTATDPFMGAIVLVLGAFLTAVTALALGLTWKGLLHWTGELLLIIGIALAAVGISDVRREWTRLPGIRGHVRQATQTIQARAASFMWAGWNRVVEKWPRLARWLHLRIHLTHVRLGDAGVGADTLMTTTSFPPVRVVASGDLTVEQRLDQLESHMREAEKQIGTLNERQEQEARDRRAATAKERAARVAEDQRIRQRMADLAGGGLKLQAWGVACLLVGTFMTAIW